MVAPAVEELRDQLAEEQVIHLLYLPLKVVMVEILLVILQVVAEVVEQLL